MCFVYYSAGWIDVWTTPIVTLNITYTYHPIPPTGISTYFNILHINSLSSSAEVNGFFYYTSLFNFTKSQLLSHINYIQVKHSYCNNIPGENSPKVPVISPISTPDAEERLLIPLRADGVGSVANEELNRRLIENFDASTMEPDLIEVELEVGPSVLCVYGCLLTTFYDLKVQHRVVVNLRTKNFVFVFFDIDCIIKMWNIFYSSKIYFTVFFLIHIFFFCQENYLGEDMKFTDYNDTSDHNSNFETILETCKEKKFDPRNYRPFSVLVNAALHDIQAHLVKVSINGGQRY